MNIWQEHGLRAPEEREPDFERFRRAVTTREPGPVPVGDLFADPGTMSAFLGEEVGSFLRFMAGNRDGQNDDLLQEGMKLLEQSVRFSVAAGWDFVTSHALLGFRGVNMHVTGEASKKIKGGRRAYLDTNSGPIMNWDDFNTYEWPESPGTIHIGAKVLAEIVPAGMKVLVLPGGLFEWVTWLMGLVPYS